MILYLTLAVSQADEVLIRQNGDKILLKDDFTWESYVDTRSLPPVIEKWKAQVLQMEGRGREIYLKKDRYGDIDLDRSEAFYANQYDRMVREIYTSNALQTVLTNHPRLLSGMSFYGNPEWNPRKYQFEQFSNLRQQGAGVYVEERNSAISYNWDEMGDGNPNFSLTEAVAILNLPGVTQQQLNKQCEVEDGFFLGTLTVEYKTKVTLTLTSGQISNEVIQANPIKVLSCEGLEY